VSNNATVASCATVQLKGIAMKSHLFGFALLSAFAIVAGAPAQAQNGSLTRSFVSSAGIDTNACTITAPCASFAQAYTKIGANGIIAALDPGKYGPLTITGPVTINGNGWAAITAPANNAGITINVSSGNVILNGLEIDGAGAAYNGVVFNSGSSLTITNCTLQNFVTNPNVKSGNGILIQPTSGTIRFTITNTTVSNNTANGVEYFPPTGGSATANGVIDHVIATANYTGITIDTSLASSGTAIVTVSNSVASNNLNQGVNTNAGGASVEALISDSHIDNNSNIGVGTGGATASGSLILRNVTVNETPIGADIGSGGTAYFSQTTITNIVGFPLIAGVLFQGGTAQSDGTSHLTPVSGGTIGVWTVQ
jgi:hypothetical protein